MKCLSNKDGSIQLRINCIQRQLASGCWFVLPTVPSLSSQPFLISCHPEHFFRHSFFPFLPLSFFQSLPFSLTVSLSDVFLPQPKTHRLTITSVCQHRDSPQWGLPYSGRLWFCLHDLQWHLYLFFVCFWGLSGFLLREGELGVSTGLDVQMNHISLYTTKLVAQGKS